MNSKPDKLVPAVIGGAIIGVISGIPFLNFINCFCCAGVILGGFFAVYFYKKNLVDTPLTYNDGALLGLLAGIFGLVISTILEQIIGINSAEMIEQMMEYAEEIPPETEELLRGLMENRGGFFMLETALGLVINAVFGLLGGIIGVAVLSKRR
ncbi:hypothetical protein JXB12_05480 [candidate division KSB1 bacterium]|nr:hypothetical protein [candidate division KSB1 bacterium]